MKIKADTKLNNVNTVKIPINVASYHGLSENGSDKEQPSINLKYFDSGYQCFSELSSEELKAFSELNNKFQQLTWLEIKKQASKGRGKRGLAPTVLGRNILPRRASLIKISEDITFLELRMSQKARIIGFRMGASFFLVFLDKDHEICQ